MLSNDNDEAPDETLAALLQVDVSQLPPKGDEMANIATQLKADGEIEKESEPITKRLDEIVSLLRRIDQALEKIAAKF